MQIQFLSQCISSAHAANLRGDYSVAENWCNQALHLVPEQPEAWYNLGLAYGGMGKKAEALSALERARIHTLTSADAQNSIGLQLIELGALPEAERCLDQALMLAPNFSFAHSNMGKLREKQKKFDEAEASFREAIRLQPDLAPAHANLGGILNAQKKHEAAMATCHKAIELDPRLTGAWNNLGVALNSLKRYDAAVATCHKAIELDPRSIDAWFNLGGALSGKKQYDTAADAYEKCLELDPDTKFGLGNMIHNRMKACDWRNFDENLTILMRKINEGETVSNVFEVLAITTDPSIQRKAAEIYVAENCPAHAERHSLQKQPRHEKIRIGYYSADFREHPVSYLMAEVFELHDKDCFDVTGFSIGRDETSKIRERVAATFDTFIDVRDKSDKEVAELSRSLGIDIAVDLGGFTEDSRTNIFALRAAPIQVNYLGFTCTMGADFIDYIIADPITIPEQYFEQYSEKVVSLPDSYFPPNRYDTMSDRIITRAECGLPERGFVYCCFNNSYKLNPTTFAVWMRILTQVEGSVLWLSGMPDKARSNLRQEAEARGVNPDRLVFAERMPSRSDHLARHQLADLFLDTHPYNAHTTASDALWAGLPVLTYMGKAFASRVAASQLNAIGLPELITTSQEAYETLAVDLATHPQKLSAIKQKLERHRATAPLFNTPLFTKHLEAAYQAMYERYLANLLPDNLHIEH